MAKIVETPLMKQYFDIKAKHPDALQLVRKGDFYRMYNEDAEKGASILGIIVKKLSGGSERGFAQSAEFPYHKLDEYLPKLIRGGERVVICDAPELEKARGKAAQQSEGMSGGRQSEGTTRDTGQVPGQDGSKESEEQRTTLRR